MADIFAQQLETLRAHALDRHLREIGSAQSPIVDLAGTERKDACPVPNCRAKSLHLPLGRSRFRL